MAPLVRVVSAAESAARDAAAISCGIPSRALMERAGAAAASEIALRYPERLGDGVLVLAGPGNNGGDGWVVARALAASGVRVRVVEATDAKTPDAIAERELAAPFVTRVPWRAGELPWEGERLVVDALLGTGSSGAPRGTIGDIVRAAREARGWRASIVAVDVPTGLDATTGDAADALDAELTITFGTIKRGQLVARGTCGRIVVVDIGLGGHAEIDDGAPRLVDERWAAGHVPAIGAAAHKGIRKKLVIVGGAPGMAGASILAARAAMRSGIGMVRIVAAPESVPAVQQAEPFALAAAWPRDDDAAERDIVTWADAVVIGPGLGNTNESRALVDRVLTRYRGPVLLDADALNVFHGDLDALDALIGDRQALLTPHPAEFARLARCNVDDVLAARFDTGRTLARRVGAAVLLKGVPTVVTAPDGEALVSAAGTPALAAAGSGDILSGIAGTLLAQTGDALVAGALAAWVHGRAAERAGGVADAWPAAAPGSSETALDRDLDEALDVLETTPRAPLVRGLTLEDVLQAVGDVWNLEARPSRYPVLLELPDVGERR